MSDPEATEAGAADADATRTVLSRLGMTGAGPAVPAGASPTGSADAADEAAPADPLALLGSWLPDSGDDPVCTMTLSTVGLDGYPDARTVLLSRFDGSRIHFHTDGLSRKAAQLAAAPRAAVTVTLPDAGRQIVVAGDVARVTPAEEALAYAHRSRYLRLLAWLNDAGTAQLPAARRRALWAAFDATHPDELLEPPIGWAGFALTPQRLAFWQADAEGPSHRLFYTRGTAGWSLTHRPG